MSADVLRGAFIGILSGIFTGVLIMISDGIFYTKFISNYEMAKKFSNPLIQLITFMIISIFYGGIQGGIFAWMVPILPSYWLIRGVVFGIVSYMILSRHFIEGLAFMNTKYVPVRLSIYLSVEFLLAYTLQGIIISKFY